MLILKITTIKKLLSLNKRKQGPYSILMPKKYFRKRNTMLTIKFAVIY